MSPEASVPNRRDPEPRRRDRFDRFDLLALAIVTIAITLPVRGLMRYQGPAMEEGFMLTFPELVLHGLVPNRDFLHLYGPGSLWVLAGVYKIGGVTLAAERLVGLAQQCGIVFGLYALTRRWGRVVACTAALMALLINVAPTGLTALAWNGGVAFALWSLWCVLRAREVDDARRARRLLLVGGLLASASLLYRPDLLLACSLGLGAALWGIGWRRIRSFVAGLGLAVVGYVVQAVMAGPGHAFRGMVLDPVFTLRAGRSLPIPPTWGHLSGYLQKAAALRTLGWPLPELDIAHQLFIWFFLTLGGAVLLAGLGWVARRRDPSGPRGRALFAIGLLGVGMCTQALQRVDQAHLSWVSCVTLAALPAAAAECSAWFGRRESRWHPRRASLAGVAVAIVLLGGLIPQYTVRGYVDVTSQSFGRNLFGASVHRDGRNFYLANADVAAAAQQAVEGLDAQHPARGDRLFVGPADLRYTPYSDAFLYYLFPELTPSTYFVEMDPFDSRPGSRLARDVASADWLILANVWNGWREPNSSSRAGSDAANEVVRREFCRVGNWGAVGDLPAYELYHRCGKRAGS